MVLVDYVFICIALISVIFGVFRGFIREALSLLTLIAAIVAALRLGPRCSGYLQHLMASGPLRTFASCALVFLAVLLTGSIITWLVHLAVKGVGLAPVDRMMGAGFGLLRGCVIVAALVMLVDVSKFKEDRAWRSSVLVPRITPFADALRGLIPENVGRPLQSPKLLQSGPEK